MMATLGVSAAARVPHAGVRPGRPQHRGRRRLSSRWDFVSHGVTRERDVRRRAEFAPIDADSQAAPGGVAEGRFGPDAILMVGFTPEETRRWREELDSIEAEFVRLVTCTKEMVKGPLGVALETVQEDASAVPSAFGFERMMFFSGMVGGEVMQLIDLFGETDMPPSIFACAVPNNWDSPVSGLIEEIVDDHKMMMEQGGPPPA